MSSMTIIEIPLFPLNMVAFPQGLLPLHIFETRYVDMVTRCYKEDGLFGVVAVYDSLPEGLLPFASVGTTMRIAALDVPEIGLFNIRCHGQQRFKVLSAGQQSDGLWVGQVEMLSTEQAVRVPEDLESTWENLRQVIDALLSEGITPESLPIQQPYQFDDCAWVANRWCELLNLPLSEKQRMLELDSGLLRLELINDLFDAQVRQ
jgi:uncharacterized protein